MEIASKPLFAEHLEKVPQNLVKVPLALLLVVREQLAEAQAWSNQTDANNLRESKRLVDKFIIASGYGTAL